MSGGDWAVEVTDTTGSTTRPPLLSPAGEVLPRRIPTANGRPTLELGVPPRRDAQGDPTWFASRFEEADVEVRLDNTRQPYATLIGVRDRPSDGVTVLRVRGGDELDQPVDVSVDGATPTHTVARDIVQSNTAYETDIPDPGGAIDTAVRIQTRTGFSSSDIETQRPTSPRYVTASGAVSLHQTCFFTAPSGSLETDGDELALEATLDYEIPAESVGVALLTDQGTDHVGLSMSVDGVEIGRIQPGASFSSPPTWVERTGRDERLAPGTHTARFEVVETSTAAVSSLNKASPDGIALFDDRFGHGFDPALVYGPSLYPLLSTFVAFREPLTTRAVEGITYNTFWQDNEAGSVWISNGESSSSTVGPKADKDFPRPGAVVEVQVGLSAYGTDPAKTPEQGFKVQTLREHRIDADLRDLPLVVNETFQGTVADVLTQLTETLRGDFVWTYDTDASGDGIVRFVRSGSRSSTHNDIERYEVTKRVDSVLDEVTVRGHPVPIAGEGIRVEQGTAVALQRDALVEGTETVVDDVTGEVYERGTHYTVDYGAGTITALAAPPLNEPIEDGSRVRVDYQFRPSATVRRSTATTPIRARVVDELPLRSDRACRLAGQQLLDAVASPSYDAVADLRGNQTYSPVTDLVGGRLPVSDLETVDIEATPAGATVRLEARQSVDATVQALRQRLESIAEYSR